MQCRFRDKDLERLYTDPTFLGGFAPELVALFRRRVQALFAATDERDLYAHKSLHYEHLHGKRQHQRSIRLNQQWRLVLEVEPTASGRVLVIVALEDYH